MSADKVHGRLDVSDDSGRTPTGAAAASKMAPNHLRNVMLPPAANSDPEKLSREVLAPLFAIPQNAVLICSEPTPLRFAQLTVGLGSFVRDDTALTLLVVLGEDATAPSVSENLRQTWRAALESEPVARRLSLYKLFAERKRLRILFRSSAQRAESDPLRVHLAEAPALVLVSDSEETRVELMWKTLLTFDARSDVFAEIRWSFGDPQHRVRRLSESIERVIESAPYYLELEATLSSLVLNLPNPDLPWEESFAEAS